MAGSPSGQDEIRERILDAAERLIAHYGFDKVTLNDISREAQVSKSTLYSRWSKKDDLFGSLLWRASSRLIDEWAQRIEDDPMGGTLPALYRHSLMAMQASPFLMRLVMQDRHTLRRYFQQLDTGNILEQRLGLFQYLLNVLQQAGTVRKDLNAQSLAYVMTCFQVGMLFVGDAVADEHVPPLENVIQTISDLVAGYVTPEDGGDPEAGKQMMRQFLKQARAQVEAMRQANEQAADRPSTNNR